MGAHWLPWRTVRSLVLLRGKGVGAVLHRDAPTSTPQPPHRPGIGRHAQDLQPFRIVHGANRGMDLIRGQKLQDVLTYPRNSSALEPRFANKPMPDTRCNQLAEPQYGILHSRGVDTTTRQDGEAAILCFNQVLTPSLTNREGMNHHNGRVATRETSMNTSLPRQSEADDLAEIVRRIVRVAAPERIILFGSAARGEAGAESDLDLLVIKSGQFHRGQVTEEIYLSLIGVRHAVDVIVVTP